MTETSTSTDRSSSSASWIAAGCALGLLAAFHPTLLSGFARVQGDLSDTRMCNYFLEHGFQWVTGHTKESFWDLPMFYPHPNVGAYSDVLLGSAPLYWLARVFGLLPDTAYQVWELVVSALNFLAFAWLLRRDFLLKARSSVAGAWVFAFGAPRLAQIEHPQLLPQFFTVVLVHALIRVFRDEARSAANWWLGAAALVGQLYAGFYLGWFAAFGLVLTLALGLARGSWREHIVRIARRDWLRITGAGVAAVAAVAPLAWHYLHAARELPIRPVSWGVLPMVPRPASWFAGDPASWFYGWTTSLPSVARLPMRQEHALTFGLVTFGAAAVGLWHGRRNTAVALIAATAMAIVVVATTTPHGVDTLWRAVYVVIPGARAIRAVSRIVLLLSIPIGLGVALAIETLLERHRMVVAGALALACFAEQMHTTPSFDKAVVRARTAALASQVPATCETFLLTPILAQERQPDWAIQTDAVWVSMETGKPTLNGYSGNEPSGWPFHDSAILRAEDETRLSEGIDRWTSSTGLRRQQVCWIKASM